MNILVYNLAAEYAGAMTILENFYKEVLDYSDKSINWYFLVSTDKLKSCENVTMITEAWVKKSWLHRLYYDNFVVQKVIKERKIDVVYSMQNMPVKRTKAKQIVYLHQSLQFSPVSFSLFDKEQRSYAIRQKFVCNIYRKSLKKADKIIVQTNWFKNAVVDWIPFNAESIEVVSPKVEIEDSILNKRYSLTEPLFFYPAGDGMHKNHEIILNACKRLKDDGIENYRVIFTLDVKTAEYSRRIAEIIKRQGLNIELVGIIPKSEVYELYSRSVLLFPSYLETFGLPLIEARKMKAIVLASDMPFCHEALNGYKNSYFYNIKDDKKLAEYMKKIIEGSMIYFEGKDSLVKNDTDIVSCILKEVANE